MKIEAIVGLAGDRLSNVLGEALPPALIPLPGIPVSAETWDEDRHVRLVGEAVYAVHRGARVEWAVIVRESNSLEPGQVRMIDLREIRCESASGRRSW